MTPLSPASLSSQLTIGSNEPNVVGREKSCVCVGQMCYLYSEIHSMLEDLIRTIFNSSLILQMEKLNLRVIKLLF